MRLWQGYELNIVLVRMLLSGGGHKMTVEFLLRYILLQYLQYSHKFVQQKFIDGI